MNLLQTRVLFLWYKSFIFCKIVNIFFLLQNIVISRKIILSQLNVFWNNCEEKSFHCHISIFHLLATLLLKFSRNPSIQISCRHCFWCQETERKKSNAEKKLNCSQFQQKNIVKFSLVPSFNNLRQFDAIRCRRLGECRNTIWIKNRMSLLVSFFLFM